MACQRHQEEEYTMYDRQRQLVLKLVEHNQYITAEITHRRVRLGKIRKQKVYDWAVIE